MKPLAPHTKLQIYAGGVTFITRVMDIIDSQILACLAELNDYRKRVSPTTYSLGSTYQGVSVQITIL